MERRGGVRGDRREIKRTKMQYGHFPIPHIVSALLVYHERILIKNFKNVKKKKKKAEWKESLG